MLHLLTKLAGFVIPNMLKQAPTARGEPAVPVALCAVCREQVVPVVITLSAFLPWPQSKGHSASLHGEAGKGSGRSKC